MSSFTSYQTLGPVVTPMIAKDKGSLGNKVNCAGEQTLNKFSNAAQTTLAATGGVVAYNLVNKATQGKNYMWNKNINKFLEAGVTSIKNNFAVSDLFGTTKNGKLAKSELLKTIRKHGKIKGSLIAKFKNVTLKGVKGAEKLLTKLAQTSGKQKALAAVVLTTLAAINYINHKHSFQAGQIDQKYTDRAKFENQMV